MRDAGRYMKAEGDMNDLFRMQEGFKMKNNRFNWNKIYSRTTGAQKFKDDGKEKKIKGLYLYRIKIYTQV